MIGLNEEPGCLGLSAILMRPFSSSSQSWLPTSASIWPLFGSIATAAPFETLLPASLATCASTASWAAIWSGRSSVVLTVKPELATSCSPYFFMSSSWTIRAK